MARLLGRLGALCARHALVVIGLWVLVAIGVAATVSAVGAETNNDLSLPGTDSQDAKDLLAERFPPQQNGVNPIVFDVDSGTLTDDQYEQAVTASVKAMRAAPHVFSVTNPVSSSGQSAGLLAKDGQTAFAPVLLDISSGDLTEETAQQVLDATEPAQRVGITVAAAGSIGSTLSTEGTETSEVVGIVAAMVILTFVLGSLVAMGLPIVTAVVGLSIALGVVGLVGHVVAIPSSGPTLATMIGLGVGIDYALFLITRHQDNLRVGMPVVESVALTVSTSGSAVVFAGCTVVIALLSLGVAQIPLVSALGLASAIAVVAAVIVAITLLPAFLGLLGHRIAWLSLPRFMRRRGQHGAGLWVRWAGVVRRHPVVVAVVSLAALVPLIIPAFSLELGQEDIGATSPDTTERQAYDLITAGFGVGYNGPLQVASLLDPVAAPSAEYTAKYDQATSLQQDLPKQQQRLEAQQRELARLDVRERVLVRRIEQAQGHPAQVERLRERLARVRDRQAEARAELAPLAEQAQRLADQARRLRARADRLQQQADALRRQADQLQQEKVALEAQAADLQRQADRLQQQADRLEAQGDRLQQQADELQAQADELEAEQQQAQQEQQQAEQLKKELTAMLTQAGGDERATDTRIVHLQDGLAATDGVVSLTPPQLNKTGDVVLLSAVPSTSPASDETAALVVQVRDPVLPETNAAGGIASHVGGYTASYVDLASLITARLLLVIGTVILLGFLLLMVAFRSLLIPLQAAVTNLLSAAAAFGVLTAAFQWGWGISLLGIDTADSSVPIASYVPLMMFAGLFGLSMDYEVFLVSHVQQHHHAGEESAEAVRSALGASARITTAAALIMASVFASFILNDDPTIKQFGVGLSVAVLLAGILVVTLAPAVLVLVGRGAWWLPRWLDRLLPHVSIEGEAATAAPPAVDG